MADDPIRAICLDQLDAAMLHRALERPGAIRISNALAEQDVARLFRASRDVFALPKEAHLEHLRVDMASGYTPPGIEGVRGKAGEITRESWDLLQPTMYPPRFPDAVPAFGESFSSLFARLEAIVMRLFNLLDATRPGKIAAYAELFSGGRHMLRVNSYTKAEAGLEVFPAHIDFGLLTVYVGGSEEGLQIFHEGEWIDLQNPLGGIVVSCGTTLRLYEPSFHALRHRVVARGEGRTSIVFFTEPRSDIILPNGVRAEEHLLKLVSSIRKEKK